MTQYTHSLCTNLFLNAAKNLGLDFQILDEETSLAKIFNEKNELLVKNAMTQHNDAISIMLARNKDESLRILRKNNIPTPKSKRFKNKEKAIKYALGLKEKFVIKPNNNLGAHGVTINPKGEKQIRKAVNEATNEIRKKGYIMVENFIKGKDYRITILNGEILAVTYRAPGYIIGDGRSTIKELIEKKNKRRISQDMPIIQIREKDINFLKNNNYTLESKPEEKKYIRLQLGCDRDIGGERHRIEIKNIPQENVDLFIKIAQILNLEYTGIDFIIPDITESYKNHICGVNETNTYPSPAVHYYDTLPGDNYFCIRMLKNHFNLN